MAAGTASVGGIAMCLLAKALLMAVFVPIHLLGGVLFSGGLGAVSSKVLNVTSLV